MDIDALGQHIRRGLIVGFIRYREKLASSSGGGFLRCNQMGDHLVGFGYPLDLLN